ncbi:NRDE family protein, partial [Pseudomonas aeruginosa]
LTNVRDPSQALGKRSRGELVADFLRGGGNPADYLAQVAGRAADYSGFNLLIGDRHQLWHYNPRVGPPRLLPAGIYGLSNAALDTPWPKLLKARAALAERLAEPHPQALLELL